VQSCISTRVCCKFSCVLTVRLCCSRELKLYVFELLSTDWATTQQLLLKSDKAGCKLSRVHLHGCRVLSFSWVSRAQNKVYVNCDHWGHSNRAVASYSMTVSQLYISLLIVSVPDSLRTACAKSLVPRLLCLFLVISIIFRVCVAKEWSVVQWTQKREQLGT